MTQVAYDPQKVLAIVDGIPVVDPASVENAFTANYNEDRSRVVKGLYGKGAHEVVRATDGTFQIMVTGKSPDNARFSLIDKLKRVVRISFVNKTSNTTVATTSAAMVQVNPGVSLGTTQGDMTWVFGAAESEIYPGGNLDLPTP